MGWAVAVSVELAYFEGAADTAWVHIARQVAAAAVDELVEGHLRGAVSVEPPG